MTKLPYITVLFSLVPVAVGLPSCESCDFNEAPAGGSHIDIAFDWQEDTLASPQGMRVAFHPVDRSNGAQVVRYDLPGRDGGEVGITPGRYSILSYNNDTDDTGFVNINDWSSATASTRETSVTSPMGMGRANGFRPVDDEPVKSTPDRLWADAAETVEITGASGTQTVTLRPHPMLCDYTFKMENVRNLDHVVKMSASITGMADGVSLSTGSVSTARCTHALNAYRKDSTTIVGNFKSFGHNQADTTHHFMELYVVTSRGTQYRIHGNRDSKWDVTSQIEGAADPRHVDIVIDGVDIPTDSTSVNTGGLDPGFDDWGNINVTVPV